MTMKLQDMLKKAAEKGYVTSETVSPWQENSILKNTNISTLQLHPNKLPKKSQSSIKKQQASTKKNKNPHLDQIGTKPRQTRDKPETNPRQTRDKSGANPGQTRDKTGTQTGTKLSSKKDLFVFNFHSLSGLQKNITLHLFTLCRDNRSKFTPPTSINNIASFCETTNESARKTMQRLQKKKIIIEKKYKQGRGGWISCELRKDVFQEILQMENHHNTGTQTETNSPLSSSSNINTTTWKNKINLNNIQRALEKLEIKGQFFNNSSLASIYKHSGDKLTSYQIQDSLDKFVYGLENHGNEEPYASMDNPGAILFKTLKNGDCWEEDRYLTPEELTIKNYYDNICATFSKSEQQHFTSWLINNRDDIFKKCQAKLPSTYYLSESEFMEKAKKEFKENILSELKIGHAIEILGEDKKELLQKIERLKSS